jgi:hypothetical protein
MTAPSDTTPRQSDLDDADRDDADRDDAGRDDREPTSERPDQAATGDIVLDAARRWARHVWWIAATGGVAGAAYSWLATPHQREIEAPWQLAIKLVAFVCLCGAIAFLPWVAGRLYGLLYFSFIFFVAYIFPRIGYFYFVDVEKAEAGSFYTHQFLLSYPGIVLTVVAAFRLGGGTPGRCLKIAATGMLIILSGLLDVMWWLVNPVDVPETIDAPHIVILTGGPISFGATIVFVLAHIPLIVGLNLLPLDRWIGRLFGTGAAAPVR